MIRLDDHGFIIKSEEGNGFRAGHVLDGCGAENILFASDIAALDLSGKKPRALLPVSKITNASRKSMKTRALS